VTDVLESPELAPEDFGSPDVAVNKDGTVRKKPGPKPGTRRKTPTAKAPGLRAPTQPKKPPANDYRPALVGLLQLPQLAITLASKFVKKDETREALQLDSMTVGIHAGNIAEAVNETAQHDEKLAALCEKIATVGPYSLVISALMVPTFQILANHKVVAPNPQMGILPADQLVATAQAMA
jgi:hypothetical protein